MNARGITFGLVAIASAAAVVAVASAQTPADRGTASQGRSAQVEIGGLPDPANASETGLARLARLQDHGVRVLPSTARTTKAPAGSGYWTVADTSEGGVCVAADNNIVFCGTRAEDVAAGRTGAEEYPPDKYPDFKPGAAVQRVQVSSESGRRYGIAPAGAQLVTVKVAGKVVTTAAVTDRLYSVEVPPQGASVDITFE